MSLTPSAEQTSRDLVPLPGGLPVDAIMDDNPRRELRAGIVIIFLFFVLFLGWAMIVRLDAAAYAPGVISVAGHRQTVQHENGGIVTALNVKEGQLVQAGDVLMTLDPGQVGAAERAMSSQVIGLQAEIARLEAERDGRRVVAVPAAFAALTGEEKADADQALLLQQRQLTTRLGAIGSQKSVLGEQSNQVSQMVQGYNQQVSANEEQAKILEEQLANTRELAAQGYAATNKVRELERALQALRGNKADLSANAARSGDQIAENRMRALTIDTQHYEDIAKTLRDDQFQLNDLLPKLAALKLQLAQTQIRAPVSGHVVGLSVFTVGGVIGPGQKLMDVVPDEAQLVIEAQVNPNDADDLTVGQKTEVRITALHERDIPVLDGKLTRLSADSLVDEKSGMRYYTAEVTVPESELAFIDKLKGENGALKPGLPVQVLVPLRKRTAFQYLTEPLTQAMWKSFREH